MKVFVIGTRYTSQTSMKLEFSQHIFKNPQISNFTKVPPEGAELLPSTTPPRQNNGYAYASQYTAAHKQSCATTVLYDLNLEAFFRFTFGFSAQAMAQSQRPLIAETGHWDRYFRFLLSVLL
jgi:hypothetical protein